MASFKKLLEEKRKDFKGESDRVAIAEAGAKYSQQVQTEVDKQFKSKPSYTEPKQSKFDNVSSAVRGIPDQLRGDIQNLEDGSYQDLIRFIRKYERLLKEVEGGRLYQREEQEYIKNNVLPVMKQIGELQGPVARAAFAFEDFKSQFKPLKLADRFLGDLPLIGGMIRERVQAKQEADRLARSTGLRAAKEKTRGEMKAAAENKPMEDNFVNTSDTSTAMEQHMAEDHSSSSGTIISKTPGGMFGGSEESQKEQLNREEKKAENIEMIAENTLATKYLLEELLEAYKDENEGMGELLDTGKGLAAGAGGAAAGGAGLFGLNKLRKKFFGKGADAATKGATKGTSKILGKTALKSVIKKIPIIGLGAGLLFGAQRLMAGDITGAGMEVASGAASMVPGAGTALSVATDAALAAKDINQANKEIDNTIEQATTEAISESKNVGLDQVYQINADQVMLKANSMKQLQDENDTMKTAMSSGQGGTQNNSVINQVTNTAKSQFLGPNLHSANPRNVVKSLW